MDTNEILKGLNKEQFEAVTHTEGPLLVIAGAGSGKTRVLTNRIAYLIAECGVKPWNIIAITFTNKAAKEMKTRIENLVGNLANDIWIGTFHSMCVRILRREISKIGFASDFTIYDTADTKVVIKECIKELNLNDKIYSDKYLLNEISKAKNDLMEPDRYSKLYASDYRLSKVAEVYELYQNKLKKNNAVDFDDIINHTIKIFQENPDVLAYYQDKFQYVLVDEYQDTNKAQDLLIMLLSKVHQNIFVVGDDQQSIYKFRGADIQNILNFEKNFQNTRVIKLEQNYRSTKNILNIANQVIKHNEGNVEKNLWTKNEDGVKPKLFGADDEYAEANYVLSEISRLKREEFYHYSDFAILYRTNAQSRAFEDVFMREGVPYKVVGGQKFYERKEIKDIIAYLRVVNNSNDDVSFKRIINEPKRGIGKASLDALEDAAFRNNMSMFDVAKNADKYISTRANVAFKDFTNMILKLRDNDFGIADLVDEILKETGYMKALEEEKTEEAEARIENLGQFISIAVEFEAQQAENTLSAFLENLALVTDLDNVDETQDAVLLMTLHTAKGLEFPVVFLVGMEEGLFPSSRSMNEPGEVEEERRLCYVGITRAKEHLFLTCAKCRTVFGSTQYSKNSRFIDEIDAECLDGKIEKRSEYRWQEEEEDDFPFSYDSKRDRYASENYRSGGYVSESYSGGFSNHSRAAFNYRTAESFLSKVSANESVDLSAFREGVEVFHKKFGKGVITKTEPEDDDLKVDISFEKSGMKRLMAKYAGLEIRG
ncbi:MAG: DNA helicase PcrA [Clostridia bacterium]|nr:DNA helicase PcrA [Clostridia bacterium]